MGCVGRHVRGHRQRRGATAVCASPGSSSGHGTSNGNGSGQPGHVRPGSRKRRAVTIRAQERHTDTPKGPSAGYGDGSWGALAPHIPTAHCIVMHAIEHPQLGRVARIAADSAMRVVRPTKVVLWPRMPQGSGATWLGRRWAAASARSMNWWGICDFSGAWPHRACVAEGHAVAGWSPARGGTALRRSRLPQ
jgi:hypothetical protein